MHVCGFVDRNLRGELISINSALIRSKLRQAHILTPSFDGTDFLLVFSTERVSLRKFQIYSRSLVLQLIRVVLQAFPSERHTNDLLKTSTLKLESKLPGIYLRGTSTDVSRSIQMMLGPTTHI